MKAGTLVNNEVRLLAPADLPVFQTLVREHVSYRYPGTEHDYAVNLAKDFLTGHVHLASFTVARTIYSLIVDRVPVGFVAAAHKLGGAVKLGPVVIAPRFRGQGLGRLMLLQVEESFKQDHMRRLYMTIPADGSDAMHGLALALGFHEEAVLKKQFSTNSNEIILGKILQTAHPVSHSTNLPSLDRPDTGPRSGDFSQLFHYLSELFYDADGNRDVHIRNILTRPGLDDISRPGWRLMRHATGELFIDLKRGGSLRLGPISCSNRSLQKSLIQRTLELPWARTSRRQFASLPASDENLLQVLIDYGFRLEGRLIAPYHPNEDAFVVGKVS